MDKKETILSHNKVTGWMKELPKWKKAGMEPICPLNWRRFEGKDICGTCETCRRCFDNTASKHAHKVTGVPRA